MEKFYSVRYVLSLFKVFTNLMSRDKNILNISEVSHFVHNSSVVIFVLLLLCSVGFIYILY